MGNKRVHKTELCLRCGRNVVVTNIERHHATCGRIPKPEELASLYKRVIVSVTGLSAHYNTNVPFIREHLVLGGVTVGEMKERAMYVRLNKPRRVFKKSSYSVVAGSKWKQRCDCGMLLFTEQQMADNDPSIATIVREVVSASGGYIGWFLSNNGRCGLCEAGA